MKSIKEHGPVLLLLLAVVLAAYGRLLSLPLWNPIDFQILQEAHLLSQAPLAMFRHIGSWLSQPALQLSFVLEYSLFHLNPTGYIAVNLLIHALNAWLVYMLVNMLFARKSMAVLAALLFGLSVGSYGKILMSIVNLEALLLAHLQLLVLYFLIRNDFRHDGRLRSSYFVLGLGLFLLAGLTKASTFSLLGCLLAYKFFFYRQRGGRAVFSRNLLILIAAGIVFYLAEARWGHQGPRVYDTTAGPLHYTWISVKNIFRYLNLMLFPLQPSALLERANPAVRLLFDARTVIRVLLTLAIASYSFFGIVFGGRAIRFFIAWTYITVLPFTGLTDTGEWLNIKHLYLTSLGFCVILAAGAVGFSGLLACRRWRRRLPYLVPLVFVAMSLGVSYQIDAQYRRAAKRPQTIQLLDQLRAQIGDEAVAPEGTESESATDPQPLRPDP